MAASTQVQTVTVSVNDVDLQVPKGELIVEAVKRLGLDIPIFCYHPRLKPVGMCRMCIVEVGFKQPDGSVRKMPKPQAACTLPASDGMVIYTDSEVVHRDRKGVLEFLLINHPLDCPICDRGGECPLQNNTLFYGPSTSRFVEMKRHLPKAFPLSNYVTLDLERCIQCGRCVRFTEEISGDSELAFRFRGANMQPSTYELRQFTSKFSGNVIEICPVGALTSSVYRFRSRPWDLETKPAICTQCSNGCNIWMDYRVGSMVRINGRTNEQVNEEWTCDKGKFGHEFYNSTERLTKPLIRKGAELVPCTWAEAFEEILLAFRGKGSSVAALAGASLSNEDLFNLRKLFRDGFACSNLDYRFFKNLPSKEEMPKAMHSIQSLEAQRAIFVFGADLAAEQPIVYLRVRKAWFANGAKVIVANDAPTEADSFAHLILRFKTGTGAALLAALEGTLDVKEAAATTGIDAALLTEAINLLGEASAPALSSQSIYNRTDGLQLAEKLVKVGAKLGGSSIYALGANHQGAYEVGLLPDGAGSKAKDRAKGTHEILAGCADGTISALWLAGTDLVSEVGAEEARKALEEVPFLVVQAHTKSESVAYASVVLPLTAPAEMDGSYTNAERRVQRMQAVLPARGEAKPAWKVFAELSMRLKPGQPDFSAKEVFSRAIEAGLFKAPAYKELPKEGSLLP